MALEVWGTDPTFINENWTDELFTFMFVSRVRRLKRTRPQIGPDGEVVEVEPTTRVSDRELFSIMGL